MNHADEVLYEVGKQDAPLWGVECQDTQLIGGHWNRAMAVLKASLSASPKEGPAVAGAPSVAVVVAGLEFSPTTVYPAKPNVTSTAFADGAAGFTLHFMSHDPNTFSRACPAGFNVI